jgi:hypothetical protein
MSPLGQSKFFMLGPSGTLLPLWERIGRQRIRALEEASGRDPDKAYRLLFLLYLYSAGLVEPEPRT